MATVRVTGWRVGLRKVSVTQTIQRHAGLSLHAAKSVTDTILDGQVVELPDLDSDAASALVAELARLGADACIVSDPRGSENGV